VVVFHALRTRPNGPPKRRPKPALPAIAPALAEKNVQRGVAGDRDVGVLRIAQ
jgi:hypothetical protein